MTEHKLNNPLTDVEFSELGLSRKILSGLEGAKFTHCTPIQSLTLPPALEGKDVAGQAQTGTGKTAAFLLVIFNQLLAQRSSAYGTNPRSLVVAPTRELAIQIHRDALSLGADTGLKSALAYGGVDYEKQRKTIQDGVDILIGTPGRLIDYMKQKVYNLKHIEVVVLDEADRMFDLGFIDDIRFLLRRMPKPAERQSLLFSATLSHRVMELAYEHMNSPETLKVEAENVTADHVEQKVFYPANDEKLPLLIGLMRALDAHHSMVFTNTRAAADKVGRTLNANGISAAVISGRVRQEKRQKLLKRFHDGDIPVLVATDVAARGLHIPDVTHIFNFDLPQDAPDYVHRIGRTARLGAKGEAISFACEDYAFHLPEIEEYIGYSIATDSAGADLMPTVEVPPAPKRNRPRKFSGKRRGGSGHKRGRSSRR
ncbi:MAG: DEAD/DEAH box helicase [Xanthomonadales bacterium]|nr:DEAD/DEAH box helicase [Gammaproteobacteria bacterium]NNK03082.1 DEAD/DEAH box helicase [Xanthomonadales bacterium]